MKHNAIAQEPPGDRHKLQDKTMQNEREEQETNTDAGGRLERLVMVRNSGDTPERGDYGEMMECLIQVQVAQGLFEPYLACWSESAGAWKPAFGEPAKQIKPELVRSWVYVHECLAA